MVSGDAVAASFAGTADARLRQILTALVHHLHDFVDEVGLVQSELDAAISFLTRTGQTCDATRQEFVLLSDVLGLSMAVDAVTNGNGSTATESTVLGPFHLVPSPKREFGDDIAEVPGGEPALVTGRVLGADGTPPAGATVDVWQADGDGYYDVQREGVVPLGHLRGLFTTDHNGCFEFRTVLPVPYPIPHDGPVGDLLAATGRHPWRPAHVHFLVTAAGHAPLTTHVFVKDSPYLDSDAVFGVKDSLIVDFTGDESLRRAHIELRLRPEGAP